MKIYTLIIILFITCIRCSNAQYLTNDRGLNSILDKVNLIQRLKNEKKIDFYNSDSLSYVFLNRGLENLYFDTSNIKINKLNDSVIIYMFTNYSNYHKKIIVLDKINYPLNIFPLSHELSDSLYSKQLFQNKFIDVIEIEECTLYGHNYNHVLVLCDKMSKDFFAFKFLKSRSFVQSDEFKYVENKDNEYSKKSSTINASFTTNIQASKPSIEVIEIKLNKTGDTYIFSQPSSLYNIEVELIQ